MTIQDIVSKALNGISCSTRVDSHWGQVKITVLDSDFQLTFAMLDALAQGLRTKCINLVHSDGHRYSTLTWESGETYIEVKEVPKELFG